MQDPFVVLWAVPVPRQCIKVFDDFSCCQFACYHITTDNIPLAISVLYLILLKLDHDKMAPGCNTSYFFNFSAKLHKHRSPNRVLPLALVPGLVPDKTGGILNFICMEITIRLVCNKNWVVLCFWMHKSSQLYIYYIYISNMKNDAFWQKYVWENTCQCYFSVVAKTHISHQWYCD